jgi:Xaa-Pro aminopeptidase
MDFPDYSDRVMHTAGDRPNTDTLPVLSDPAADHLDLALSARRADVEEKHRRVAAFLDQQGLDALILGRADSLAWFTSGGDLGQQTLAGDPASVFLFVNRTSRAILCDNVQSARVFEEEVAGLGFQLKERPWYDEPSRSVAEIGRGKKVATDGAVPFSAWPDVAPRLRILRSELTRLDRQRMRELGRTLTLAVEATSRNFQPGETEADLVGHLAHRLLREGVVPVDVRVAGDDRLLRYRQPAFKSAEIARRATITAVGRRHGLCAAVTRIVSFGPPPAAVVSAHGLAAMIDATCLYFSRPGETIGGVVRRARRIFEKFDRPDEWTLDYQGALIAFAPREMPFLPESPHVLSQNCALRWGPSVDATRSEDTVVIDSRGYEVVTEAQVWPKLEVVVKGFTIPRAGILVR